MKNTAIVTRSIAALAIVASLALPACSHAGSAPAAPITRDTALQTALARAPGTPDAGELETENGHLVWSFDIKGADGKVTEVQVDANSGAIVAVEDETAAQEAPASRQASASHLRWLRPPPQSKSVRLRRRRGSAR